MYVCMYGERESMCVMACQSVSQMHVCMYGERESMCMMVCQSVSQMRACMSVCMYVW
jgi:hypothetical protein